ncbi:MAG: hypothetical protein QNJ44_23865 [Rhodobacter sp.]|nr:hypothetical protein [Rhodobacter sp.]
MPVKDIVFVALDSAVHTDVDTDEDHPGDINDFLDAAIFRAGDAVLVTERGGIGAVDKALACIDGCRGAGIFKALAAAGRSGDAHDDLNLTHPAERDRLDPVHTRQLGDEIICADAFAVNRGDGKVCKYV